MMTVLTDDVSDSRCVMVTDFSVDDALFERGCHISDNVIITRISLKPVGALLGLISTQTADLFSSQYSSKRFRELHVQIVYENCIAATLSASTVPASTVQRNRRK